MLRVDGVDVTGRKLTVELLEDVGTRAVHSASKTRADIVMRALGRNISFGVVPPGLRLAFIPS